MEQGLSSNFLCCVGGVQFVVNDLTLHDIVGGDLWLRISINISVVLCDATFYITFAINYSFSLKENTDSSSFTLRL